MFSRSINLFRVRGIQISLHSLFFLLLAYFCYVGWHDGGMLGAWWSAATLLIFFACIVLHELGHSFVAIMFGVKVRGILLTPIGGMAQFDSIPRKPSQELLITIAGPAVNFAIAGALWFAVDFPDGWDSGLAMGSFGDLGRTLLVWNVYVGLFNLVPAFPMDGGRILRALLATRLPYARATFWAATVSKIIAVPGGIFELYKGNYIVATICVFVFFAGEAEYRAVLYREQHEARWLEMQSRPPEGPTAGEPPLLGS
jgi:Zn-dependent protease